MGPAIDCVLLDIEGTVCPISFVKDTLFPYAIRALPKVLADQWNLPEFVPYRDDFPPEHASSPEKLQAHVEDLTARDVKIAYLKNLQGYLWKDGYQSGAYSTPLFPDVGSRLKQWNTQDNKQLAIYSSGSVFAQKLLFRHVERSDSDGKPIIGEDGKSVTESLEDLITGWFDTTNAGLKADPDSYAKIAAVLQREPATILFLSDNVKEVDAAIAAGLRSILVDRPGNAPLSHDDRVRLQVVENLDQVTL